MGSKCLVEAVPMYKAKVTVKSGGEGSKSHTFSKAFSVEK